MGTPRGRRQALTVSPLKKQNHFSSPPTPASLCSVSQPSHRPQHVPFYPRGAGSQEATTAVALISQPSKVSLCRLSCLSHLLPLGAGRESRHNLIHPRRPSLPCPSPQGAAFWQAPCTGTRAVLRPGAADKQAKPHTFCTKGFQETLPSPLLPLAHSLSQALCLSSALSAKSLFIFSVLSWMQAQ